MNLNFRIFTTLSILFIAAIAIGSACAAPTFAIDDSSNLNVPSERPVASLTSWDIEIPDFDNIPDIGILNPSSGGGLNPFPFGGDSDTILQ